MVRWLYSTNAKDIGTLYLIFAVFAAMIGTAFSVLTAVELIENIITFSYNSYNFFEHVSEYIIAIYQKFTQGVLVCSVLMFVFLFYSVGAKDSYSISGTTNQSASQLSFILPILFIYPLGNSPIFNFEDIVFTSSIIGPVFIQSVTYKKSFISFITSIKYKIYFVNNKF